MIDRNIKCEIEESLRNFPVVAILGPRQSGKSTIAKYIISKFENFLYWDLEAPQDIEEAESTDLHRMFITPGSDRYKLQNDVSVTSLKDFLLSETKTSGIE